MTRSNALLMAAAVSLVAGTAYADPERNGAPQPVTQIARAGAGSLHGVVSDEAGAPIEGATVSAIGATMVFAVTDSKGRFEFNNLPSGRYVLRAHRSGFSLARREFVEIGASARIVKWLELQRAGATGTSGEAPERILAAGLGGDAGAPQPGESGTAAEPARPGPAHPHTETAWRLRHARRSVLKDASEGIAIASAVEGELDAPADLAPGGPFFAGLFSALPFSGQINLLTTGAFDRPGEIFESGIPHGVTYVQLGSAGDDSARWTMQAAMSQGEVSSWIVAGSFAARGPGSHALDMGLSYGAQAYAGGNSAALVMPSDGTRSAGALYAFDNWSISPRVQLAYGARVARYDYVSRDQLWNPRIALEVGVAEGTRVRAVVAQGYRAPGAEEFLPPQTGGPWLPPERTFSPLDGDDFRVERIRQLQLTLERELGASAVIALRRFHESVDDQLVTVFGARTVSEPRSDVGHYLIGTAGAVEADGWGVKLSSPVVKRLRGSVDYSLTRARWASAASPELSQAVPSAVRGDREDVHDVATSVEADIDETATRVFFYYRISSAYAREDDAPLPALGARFDLQVAQALPFMPFRGSEWQVLLGIRDLFRDPLESSASVYDELLVVRPPTRVVGGVQVKF